MVDNITNNIDANSNSRVPFNNSTDRVNYHIKDVYNAYIGHHVDYVNADTVCSIDVFCHPTMSNHSYDGKKVMITINCIIYVK